MGAFDRSFHDLLKRYQHIKETALFDDKGEYMGDVDDKGQFQAVTKGGTPPAGAAGVDDFEAVTQPGGGADAKAPSDKVPAAVPASVPAPAAAPADAASQPAAAAKAPTPEDIKQQGQTGAAIKMGSGGNFANVQDRLNQQKVDAVLGKDPAGKSKFRAGTAEANMALADYYRKNPVGVTPGKPGSPAGATGQPAGITPAEFDVRRAAQTGVARPNSAASATPAQATGVPAGTTPQQFDARRAAQTGITRPTAAAPAAPAPSVPSAPAATATTATSTAKKAVPAKTSKA